MNTSSTPVRQLPPPLPTAGVQGSGPPATLSAGRLSPAPAVHSEATVFRAKTGVPVIQVIRATRDKHGHVVELLYVTAAADQNVFLYEDLPIR